MTSVNQQSQPLGDDDPLRFAILMDLAWRAFRRRLDEGVTPRVAGLGLRPSHLRLLSLTPTDGMGVTDLAARVGMTKQALGEFVTTLQAAGLVEVTVDRRDRRVSPTPSGQELQQVVESAIAGIERRWASQVGPKRWATFREVLTEIGR